MVLRLGRIIRVLTPTGRWEYMRIVEVSPLHVTVMDATGHRYLTGKPRP